MIFCFYQIKAFSDQRPINKSIQSIKTHRKMLAYLSYQPQSNKRARTHRAPQKKQNERFCQNETGTSCLISSHYHILACLLCSFLVVSFSLLSLFSLSALLGFLALPWSLGVTVFLPLSLRYQFLPAYFFFLPSTFLHPIDTAILLGFLVWWDRE